MGNKNKNEEMEKVEKVEKATVRVTNPFDLKGNRFYPVGNYAAEIKGDVVTLFRTGTPYKKLSIKSVVKVGG